MGLRLARLALLAGWAVCLVVYALPRELQPGWWARLRAPLRQTLELLKLRPSHTVFSGAEGDRNRHLWAVRFVGTYPDGSEQTLEEWPEGMTWSTPMVFFDPLDTAWYRLLGKGNQVRLSRAAATPREQEVLTQVRRSSGVRRMTRFWCESSFSHQDGAAPVSVHLDAFYASKSYKTGRVRMSSSRIGRRRCAATEGELPRWIAPPDPPPWFVATPAPSADPAPGLPNPAGAP